MTTPADEKQTREKFEKYAKGKKRLSESPQFPEVVWVVSMQEYSRTEVQAAYLAYCYAISSLPRVTEEELAGLLYTWYNKSWYVYHDVYEEMARSLIAKLPHILKEPS